MLLDLPLTCTAVGLATASLNVREHHLARARRVKSERAMVGWCLLGTLGPTPPPVGEGLVITLVRVAPRRLDSDNAVGALKACRDAVAAWLGIDDGSPLLDWRYDQASGQHAVRVTIERLLAPRPVPPAHATTVRAPGAGPRP